MSILLTQAKDFEQKSKEHQQRIEQALQSAFSEHAKSVVAELKESERRISYAIRDHEQSMTESLSGVSRRVIGPALRISLIVLLTTGLLFATSWALQWYQASQIAENWRLLEKQKNILQAQEKTLADVGARTWGVRYQTAQDGKRYLVMPKGTRPLTHPYGGTYWVELTKE